MPASKTIPSALIIGIIFLLAVPLGTATIRSSQGSTGSTVPVNLLVAYGNGTRSWYKETLVPANWNYYNVTVFDTKGNVGAAFFASFGSHFIYSINGAGCPADNIFCDNAWGLWLVYGGCTQLALVGVDQVTVSQARTVAWFLTSAETSGSVPPIGNSCTPVNIDVKPGSTTARINSESSGTIPVAILSSESFDATTSVAIPTLTFGRTGIEKSLVSCKIADVNGDGLSDLICHFDTHKSDLRPGDTTVILNGETVDNSGILGTAAVAVF